MHITLIAPGKLKDPSLKALYEAYKNRLEWKLLWYERFPESMIDEKFLITLDAQGDSLTSHQFSSLLEEIQVYHQGKAIFVLGDAEGIPQSLKARAQRSIAFGKLTWPHLFARVMLLEQLYRAQQILKGHPYHRV